MEPPVLSDSLVLQTKEPINSKSQFEWAKTLCLHAVAFVVVCVFSSILAANLETSPRGDGSVLATIGLSFGYFTVLACWTTFGQSTLRFVLVPILLFCAYVMLIVFAGGPGFDFEILVAITVASAAFFALMLFSSFVLRWVSKIRVHHRSNSDEAYSERLRYGIGELLLATGVVAMLIAIGKTTSVDLDSLGDFKRVIVILTLLGLFHFILYWPVFLASLTCHRRILTMAGAVLVIAITIPAEVIIHSDFMNPGGMRGNRTEAVYPILLLDLPFVFAIASHLTVAYLLGYRLVMRKRESLQQPESATDSSTVFS